MNQQETAMAEPVDHVPFGAMHFDVEFPGDSPGPHDLAWIRACARQLIAIDGLLDPHDAETIGAEMAQQRRWRSLSPEAAATSLILDLPRGLERVEDGGLAG
jgi:hypothetical protein